MRNTSHSPRITSRPHVSYYAHAYVRPLAYTYACDVMRTRTRTRARRRARGYVIVT